MEFPLLPILFLLVLSAFFSSAETSLFSLSKVGLKEIENKFPKVYKKIRHLLEHPAGLVATILIGNECASVLISNILATYYNSHFHSWLVITIVNLFTALPLIVIFGEITPKIIAAKRSVSVAKFSTPFIWFFYRSFWPIRFIIEYFINSTAKVFGIQAREIAEFDENDFLSIIEDSKHSGAIGESEKELIEKIFELDDDKAGDIATPIGEFFCVHKEDQVEEILPMLKENEIYRIPILGDFPNDVVGVLYTKDLLTYAHQANSHIKVTQLMKEPMFMDPATPLEKAFKKMRQSRTHIAFLAKDNKTTQGVITMDDILEQIFGEVWESGEMKE